VLSLVLGIKYMLQSMGMVLRLRQHNIGYTADGYVTESK